MILSTAKLNILTSASSFVREKEEEGFIHTFKVLGDQNPADGLTKPQTRGKHDWFVNKVTSNGQSGPTKSNIEEKQMVRRQINMFVAPDQANLEHTF
jgi:hypothetical protein